MIRSLFRNAGWKLVSLAMAVLLWVSVASEPELSMFASVPVQYKELPQDVAISSEVVESVYLELRGPAGELREFAESNESAVILEMGAVRAGERTFNVDSNSARLPRALRLVRAIPSQIRFDFERRVRRDVPVEVRFVGAPPGYEVVRSGISPPSLTVEGPESHVERLQAVMADPIDLHAVVGTAEFRVNTFINDPLIQFTSDSHVVVRVTMRKI